MTAARVQGHGSGKESPRLDTKMFPFGRQKTVRSQRTKITALHVPYASQFYHGAPKPLLGLSGSVAAVSYMNLLDSLLPFFC